MTNHPQFTPGIYKSFHGVHKHQEAVFIKAKNVFVAKVYGHDGQPVDANADLLCAAPLMYKALAQIIKDLKDALDSESHPYPESIKFGEQALNAAKGNV